MNNYNFDHEYNRTGTGCYKADGLMMKFGKTDLLSLWVADMDFAVAPEILSAWQQRIQHPIFGYNFRLDAYYQAIIDWIGQHYHWQIRREWIINTPGVVTAINVAVQVFTNPGDKILIQTPVYEQFFEAVHSMDRTLVTNSLLYQDESYSIDFTDLDAKLAGCKLFLLCSPHNPVGRVWTKAELLEMGNLCRKHNCLVIADEIHADLLYDERQHIPFASLADFADSTISCYSPSKSFNLAGLCNSAIIIPADGIRQKYSDFVFKMHLYLGNTFGIIATQTAYTSGLPWLQELIFYLQNNRDFLIRFFMENEPRIKVIKPEGTYLAWLDLSAVELSDEQIKVCLLEKAKVALNAGTQYGDQGSGFVRLNFGCPLQTLKTACQRICAAFH
jgi:cystathionine beta-lyase